MNSGKDTPALDKKAIRSMIIAELRENYPNFNRLPRQAKRQIAEDACKEVRRVAKQGQLESPQLTQAERIGLGEIPAGVKTLEEMKRELQEHRQGFLQLKAPSRRNRLKDPVLRKMDEVLVDSFLDRLLAPTGMTPAKRTWMPSRLLRIELLRTYRYPELTSRMEMQINLMVFLLTFFLADDFASEKALYALDSTDVAIPINNQPLAKLELPGVGHIRLYADLDCDCGKRRNKRNKSPMFVGYRIHTLCVIDVQRQYAFPVLSLAVAANHHDSQVLEPMLALAKAIGLDVRLLSLDEAYANADQQKELLEEQKLIAVSTPKSKAKVPPDVDAKSGQVFCHEACEQAMTWCGYDSEAGGHCYRCEAEMGSCPFEQVCSKERTVDLDTGKFGPIPSSSPLSQTVKDLRKVAERPFNLLKHFDGVEPCRMKTQTTFSAQMVFSQMIGLFKVMAELRAQPKERGRPIQEELLAAS